MGIWEKTEEETVQAYEAFKCYLTLEGRSFVKVAEKLRKSESLIRRWASRYEWRQRAAAWDAAIFEETRKEIKASLSRTIRRQWTELEELQRMAIKNLRKKDLSKASPKTLNEMYQLSLNNQWTLADKLGVSEPSSEQISIKILDV